MPRYLSILERLEIQEQKLDNLMHMISDIRRSGWFSILPKNME